MKAKDTVIETEAANLGDCPHPQSLIQAIRVEQAEVAFKAGIKEVVDSLDWESTHYQTMEGSPIIQLQISKADWQAKLKSWGIE